MKVGVIGVGHLGKEHARIYYQLPNVKLIGVVDINESQAKSIAKKYKTQYFLNYKELLNKVDAVSIATPTKSHYEIAKEFIDNKVHVLIEKPITDTVEKAEDLVERAEKNNVKIQVGHIERFNPAVMEILKRNLEVVYIEALRLSPFRFRSGDIGVVLDLMIHDIDIILALVKSEVEKVDAVGINLLGKNEDMANARITFVCGCVANITSSRASLKSLRQIRIFAKDCYVSLDYKNRQAKIYKKPSDLDLEKINLQSSIPKKFLGLSFEEIFFSKLLLPEKISMKSGEPLYIELNSFINSIQENKLPLVSGRDGLKAIKVADMVIADIKRNLERVKKRFKKNTD